MEKNYGEIENKEKYSLNNIFANLSIKEEFSVSWQVFKKSIVNFILINFYVVALCLFFLGLSYFLYKFNIKVGVVLVVFIAIICLIVAIYWQLYLYFYIVLKTIHGNVSILNFTEIKSVLPRLFMFVIRGFIFSTIIYLVLSPSEFFLRLAITSENDFSFLEKSLNSAEFDLNVLINFVTEFRYNAVLLFIGLAIYSLFGAFGVFINNFYMFFLVYYPTATFRQAFDFVLKFIRKNYKNFLHCLLPSLILILINSFSFYWSVKYLMGQIIKPEFQPLGFNFGYIICGFLLFHVVYLVFWVYVTTYIGVVFKKYVSRENLLTE